MAAVPSLLALLLALPPACAATFEQELASGHDAILAEEGEDEDAPAAPLPDRVDLSHLWADGPRDQAGLNSCHAFAAVALLEAAHFRATGAHVRLSEADLFARGTALRGLRSVALRENGLLREQLDFGLRTGVWPGDGYAELVARHAESGRLAPLKGKAAGLEALLPPAATAEAAAGREAVAASFASFEARSENVLRYAGTAARTMAKGRAVSCRVKARRRDRVMRRLAAGIPLGAGVLLNGVSDPDLAAQSDAVGGQHYVLLTGYERRADGVVFSIRNSWGRRPGWDAALTEDDLCALFALTWVALPGDRR
jgi:hypothetical protein